MYQGAEDLITGANDDKFTRWLTRRYRKKGVVAAEEQDEAAAEPEPGP